MSQSRKKNLIIAGALLFTVLLLFLSGLPYILQLPVLPDIKTVPVPLRKQISKNKLKIYFLPTADNLGKLGMVYHSSANYNEALQCYKLAIRRNNSHFVWNYYLGYLCLEKGDVKEALDNFKEVIRQDPNNYMAVYYSGESCQRLNETSEAEKYFNQFLAFNDIVINERKPVRENYFPIKIYAKYNLARIYLDSERKNESEKILKEIINEQITFGPAFRLLGNLYTQKGDSVLGKKYTIRAKDQADYAPPIDPMIDELLMASTSELYLLKGIDVAINNRNFQWALKLCNHSLKYLPDNKYLLSKAIKVFIKTGNEGKAYALVEKHIMAFQKDLRELIEMADFFMNQGKDKMGILYFAAAKKLEPENPILPVWLLGRKFGKAAETLAKEQLKKTPQNPKFLFNAANISLGNNQKDSAVSYLKKAIEIAPSDPDIKRYAGYIAYKEKKLDEAIDNWKKVIKNDVRDIGLIRNLNKVYKQKERWKDSFDLLHQALEDNPNDPQLLDEFGKLLVLCPDEKIRNVEEGRDYSERTFYSYYYSFETHVSSSRNLATAYAILGDKKMAAKFVNITLDLAKDLNQQEFLKWSEELKKKYNL